jgi:hypothetical protein
MGNDGPAPPETVGVLSQRQARAGAVRRLREPAPRVAVEGQEVREQPQV